MNFENIVLMNKKAGEAVKHTHSMWEFILAVKGEGNIVADGEVVAFKRGTVVCIPPGVVHHNTADNDYAHIAIRIKGFVNPMGNALTVFLDDDDRTFENLAKIALKMYYRQDKASEKALGSLCDVLCALLLGAFEDKNKNPEVEVVKKLCVSNFVDPEFRITDAIEKTNYSNGHLRKLFKKETGVSPVGYLMNLRLEYAKKILEENSDGGVRISYVAQRSGFFDQRYFSRVFKMHFGITPQRYLSRFGAEENRV